MTSNLAKATNLESLSIDFELDLTPFTNLKTLFISIDDLLFHPKLSLPNLESLTLSHTTYQPSLSSLNQFTTLQSLKIANYRIIPRESLTGLTRLSSLSVRNLGQWDPTTLSCFSNLHTLDLIRVYKEFTESDFQGISKLKNLTNLSLLGVIHFSRFEVLLPRLNQLESLKLSFSSSNEDENSFTDDGISKVLSSLNPDLLTTLCISTIPINDFHFDLIGKFYKLTYLALRICASSIPTDHWFEGLSQIQSLERLFLTREHSRIKPPLTLTTVITCLNCNIHLRKLSLAGVLPDNTHFRYNYAQQRWLIVNK